jgi:hypothetical protein
VGKGGGGGGLRYHTLLAGTNRERERDSLSGYYHTHAYTHTVLMDGKNLFRCLCVNVCVYVCVYIDLGVKRIKSRPRNKGHGHLNKEKKKKSRTLE